jgi:outer membrane protein TolC
VINLACILAIISTSVPMSGFSSLQSYQKMPEYANAERDLQITEKRTSAIQLAPSSTANERMDADESLELSRARLAHARVICMSTLVRTAGALMGAEADRLAAEKRVSTSKRELESARVRYARGLCSETDVKSAELSMSGADSRLANAERMLICAKKDWTYYDEPVPAYGELPQYTTQSDLSVAKHPIYLSALYELRGVERRNACLSEQATASIDKHKCELDRDTLTISLGNTRHQLEVRLQSARGAYSEALESYELAQRAVEVSERSLSAARHKHDRGDISDIELLRSQQRLAEDQARRVTAWVTVWEQYYEMHKALGG